MTPPDLARLPGARRIETGENGNILFHVPTDEGPLVLKLYRRRRSRLRQALSSLSNTLVERKRRCNPWSRCETERLSLDLWSAHGFDVFRSFERPLPDGIAPPGLWMEYQPGRLLSRLLRDPAIPWAARRALIERLGRELARRHEKAIELDEPLLAQEHATANHVLVAGERMITFDLEGGFGEGFPVREALVQELASCLRSIVKPAREWAREALASLAAGYGSRDLLRELAQWGVRGGGLYRSLKRLQDRVRRPTHSKTEVLGLLLTHLPAAPRRTRPAVGIPSRTAPRRPPRAKEP